MAQKNSNLASAKKEKNDEFYTQLVDVSKELSNYSAFFSGKVVLCNCDDPEWSNFWIYFVIFLVFFLIASVYVLSIAMYLSEAL